MSRRLVAPLALIAIAGTLVLAATAGAYSQDFCGRLVAPNDPCFSAGYHSYNIVSNTYPSASTLYKLCVGQQTEAGNWKAVRNGTTPCAFYTSYHNACFNKTPYSRGAVWWFPANPSGAQHTLNGWAATFGAGCPQ